MGAIDPQVFAQHTDAKLRVWFSDGVNGFQQLTPDRPFASVPYAFSAGNAETAGSASIDNGAVTKSMLSSEVINDLDRKITMDDLDPAVIADLNDSVADGSIGASKLSSEVNNALKPVVLSQPNSVVSANGGSAYLSIEATGGNNFYQWKKDGVDIVGATSPSLSITDLNASQHEGSYTVVVSNAFGSATSSLAQIDVNGSLTEGLVGWWKFDETEGNIAYDSSGNGNDGNLTNGPTWVEGKIGGALNFDGVDDYVNFGVRSVFNLESEITVSLWIKASDYKYAQVISKSTLSGGFTWAFKWRVSTERFYFRMYDPSGQYETFLRYNQNPALNEWSNILFSYGNSNSNLYLNSNLEAEGDFTATLTNQTNPLLVGGAGSEMFLGLIDDVRIYDRALSADEVKALYELGEEPEQASGSDTTTVVNGTVADGSITTNQLSEQILKYLKPEITQQPIAGNIFADTDYTFSISAEGKYLTYQWKKNGVNLSGETNATLTITDANATQHDGNYSVVVSNDFGSVESGAKTLIVLNSEMDGLIGWWPLDGNTSDISGSEYHGSLSGATSSNDRFGQTNGCYYFDGVNDYINLGRPANGLNDFSFCVNLKSSQIKSYGAHGNPAIIGIRQSSGSIDDYNLATNNGILAWYDEMGTVNTFENSGKFICDNDWHLVVFSRNSDQFRFYVDGEEEHSFTGNMTPLKNEELDLGRSLWSDAIYFNGYIDDVRIYDRALSPTEVLALYQSGL
jgi:hypothetical protein